MNRIYEGVMYKPRIWGLYFTNLMTCAISSVIALMILSIVSTVYIAAPTSILILAGTGSYFYYTDNRDEVEYQAKKTRIIKKRITSYSISDQKARFVD